jgi:hypothetical protein
MGGVLREPGQHNRKRSVTQGINYKTLTTPHHVKWDMAMTVWQAAAIRSNLEQ